MFRCKKCKGESSSTGSLNSTQVHVGEDKFEIVPTFQYFGDILEKQVVVQMQLAHSSLQYGKAFGNYCQSLLIMVFR